MVEVRSSEIVKTIYIAAAAYVNAIHVLPRLPNRVEGEESVYVAALEKVNVCCDIGVFMCFLCAFLYGVCGIGGACSVCGVCVSVFIWFLHCLCCLCSLYLLPVVVALPVVVVAVEVAVTCRTMN